MGIRYNIVAAMEVKGGRVAEDKIRGVGRAGDDASKGVGRLGDNLKGLATRLIAAGSALAVARSSLDSFLEVETALVGVAKTTGLAGSELSGLALEVDRLGKTTVPLKNATSRLLEIGEAAGQLGVSGAENILAYAETIGKLGAASDLVGPEAAKTLTRIMNVQGEGPENIDRLASVIVRLGNESAASESEIARITNEVSLATAQFRIGSTEAAAYGSAMAEIGVRAELGGSVVGRTMRALQAAVSEGGEDLKTFATVSGVAVDELTRLVSTDPTGAFNQFLQGLARYGEDAGGALEAVGLAGEEVAKVLPTLAANYDKVAEKLRLASDEAREMTALDQEAAAAFATTQAELDRLQNTLSSSARVMAAEFAPGIREVVESATDWVETNHELVQGIGVALNGAIVTLAENAGTLATAVQVIVGVGVSRWAIATVAALNPMTVAFVALAAAVGSTVEALDNWGARSTRAVSEMVSASSELANIRATVERGGTYDEVVRDIEAFSARVEELRKTLPGLRDAQRGHAMALRQAVAAFGEGSKHVEEYSEKSLKASAAVTEAEGLVREYEEAINALAEQMVEAAKSGEDLAEGLGDVGDKAGASLADLVRFKGELEEVEDRTKRTLVSLEDLAQWIDDALEHETGTLSGPFYEVFKAIGDIRLEEEHRLQLQAQLATMAQTFKLTEEERLAVAQRIGIEVDRQVDKWSEIMTAGDIFADSLGGVDKNLASIVDSALTLADAFRNIGEDGGKLNAALAGAQAFEALAHTVGGANNYAAEGAAVGALIGGIIGGIASGGSATSTGAALGSAIGSGLGALINKGSDKFLGTVRQGADGAIQELSRLAEGDMGSIGDRFLDAIARGVDDVMDAIGGSMTQLPKIEVSVRDGIFSVFVAGLTARFESMEEAVDYAILEGLRYADIEGISDEVRAVLERSTAATFQGLADDLDFAQMLASLPEVGELASDAALAIDNAVREYKAALKRAAEFGIDSGKLDQQFGRDLESIRMNILGIVETQEERIRREAEAFNREVELLRAETTARVADLAFKKANLQASLDLQRAEQLAASNELGAKLSLTRTKQIILGVQGRLDDVELEQLRVHAELIGARGNLFQVENELYRAQLGSLSQVAAALEAAQKVLDGLPDLISDDEIEKAIRRAKGGGGRRQRRADLREEASLFGVSDLEQQIMEVNEWLAAFGDEVGRLGFSAEEAAELMAGAAEEADRRLAEIKSDVMGRVGGFLGSGGLSQAMDDIGNEAAGLIDELVDLTLAGEMAREEFRDLAAQLNQVAAEKVGQLFNDEVSSLFLELYGYLGREEEAAALQFDLKLAELKIAREELAIAAKKHDLEMGVLDDLDILIRDLELQGSLNGPGGGPPPAGPGQPPYPAPAGTFWVLVGGRWELRSLDNPNAPGSVGGPNGPAGDPTASAQSLLDRYLQGFMSPLDRALLELEEDFELIRDALGNTLEVQEAYAMALQQIMDQHLGAIQDMLDGLDTSQYSPLSIQDQYDTAFADLAAIVAAVQGGDFGALDDLPGAAQLVLDLAQQLFPTGSQAYQTVFELVQGWLQDVVSGGSGGGVDPGTGIFEPGGGVFPGGVFVPTGGGGGIGSQDETTQALRMSSEGSYLELRAIRRLTEQLVGVQESVAAASVRESSLYARVN